MAFQQAQTATKSFGFMRSLKIVFIGLFISLLLLDASYSAIQQRSITPFFTEVGKSLFEPMSKIDSASNTIISQGGIFGQDISKFESILLIIRLILGFMTILTWIQIFMWLYTTLTPLGDSRFGVLLLSLITMYVAQTGYLSYIYWGTDKGFLETASIPFKAFIHFYQAIGYIIHPIKDTLQKLEETIPN